MVRLTGIIGAILFCAGMHQLWLARAEVMFWLGRFVQLFTLSLRAREAAGAAAAPAPELNRQNSAGTLHLVGGLGLICFGSLLVVVALALVVLERGLF
jgi:hypothetical protein